jgi:UDP-N-acetylglucosamine 3-dehydrogenase
MRELTIVGKDSSAVCDYNVAQYKIKTIENRHEDEHGEIKAMEGAVHQLEFPPEEPLRAELAAFLDSIETRKRPLVDGADGAEAVRIVEAAMESARTGKWIDIN